MPESALDSARSTIASGRIVLAPLSDDDTADLVAYQLENRDHLAPWEPSRTDAHFSAASTGARVTALQESMIRGAELAWAVRLADGEFVGLCHFSNIVRGPFQACHLGFSIGRRFEGKGLMREALVAAIPFMFAGYQLHRIMANYRPENVRSARLLASVGFQQEGFAKSYLKINGQWADHVLASMLNPAESESSA